MLKAAYSSGRFVTIKSGAKTDSITSSTCFTIGSPRIGASALFSPNLEERPPQRITPVMSETGDTRPFLLPDWDTLLDRLDHKTARLERLLPVRGGGGDHDRRLADRHPPDPVDHRHTGVKFHFGRPHNLPKDLFRHPIMAIVKKSGQGPLLPDRPDKWNNRPDFGIGHRGDHTLDIDLLIDDFD